MPSNSRCNNLKTHTLGFFILLLPLMGAAQDFQYSGTSFYFPSEFPFENYDYEQEIVLRIYSETQNCVNISLPGAGFESRRFSVGPDSALSIRLDTLFSAFRTRLTNPPSFFLEDSVNKGFLVEAVYPVSLEIISFMRANWSRGASFLIPPVERLGKHYLYFGNALEFTTPNESYYYILFSPESHDLEVKVAADTEKFSKDSLAVFRLMAFDPVVDSVSYHSTGHHIGSLYESVPQSNFGIYSYARSGHNPFCLSDEDMTDPPLFWPPGDQVITGFVPDVSKGGTEFLMTSFEYESYGKLRCMSLEDSNLVYIDGVLVDSLNTGEVFDTCGLDEAILETEKPVLASYNTTNFYHVDTNYQHRPTGIMACYMPHTGQMIRHTRFTAEGLSYADSFFVNLYCRTEDTALFMHNGGPWQNLDFRPFAHDSSYSYARVNIKEGEHRIEHPNGFNGIYYAMTLGLDFRQDVTNREYRFEDHAYALGGIGAGDALVRDFSYSTNGVDFHGFSEGPPRLCVDQPLYLLASNARQLTWQWDFGNGDTLHQEVGDEEPDTLVITYTSPGTYNVNATQNKWECMTGAALQVEIVEAGALDFSYEVIHNCEGSRLTAQASGDFNKFSWYINGIREGNGKELEFPLSGYDSTELELLLKAEDTHCRDSLSREINTEDFRKEPEYPNVFTPNGDGINDCFKITNVENYVNCFELSIYNRWGAQVFHSTDPTECWEGGNLAPGVYYYTSRIGEEDQKGSLTLMR